MRSFYILYTLAFRGLSLSMCIYIFLSVTLVRPSFFFGSSLFYRKIFIGGLSFSTTDDTLRAYFKDYGTITDAVVMKDSLSRRSRGFGFITFAHPSSVDIVLSKPEHVIDNRRVEAKRAVPRADTGKAPDPASGIARPSVPSTWNGNGGSVETCATSPETVLPGSPNRVREIGRLANDCGDALKTGHQQAAGLPCAKVFVGGLHYDTRDSEFRTYFEKFGKVISAEVMFNRETRKSRGFGFVVFESVESAAAVLKFTHHTIGNKLVEVGDDIDLILCPPPDMGESSIRNSRTHLSLYVG